MRGQRVMLCGWMLACAMPLWACASGEGTPDDVWMAEQPPILIGQRVATGLSAPGETEFLFRPATVTMLGDTVLVADTRNDRLVLFDRELRFLASIGREGEGPGELDGPNGARVSASAIVVSELQNARFTVLHRDGSFAHTLGPAPDVSTFSVTANGAVLAPDRSTTHFALRYTQSGAEPVAPRPPEARHGFLPWLAVTAGDTLHVFDDESGTLYQYSPTGELLMQRRLPRTLLDSLFVLRARRASAFGGGNDPAGTPMLRSIQVTPAGDIALGLLSGRTVGVLVDPSRYRVTRLVLPDTAGDWEPLRTASDFTLDGDRLFVLSFDDVYTFAIRSGRAAR